MKVIHKVLIGLIVPYILFMSDAIIPGWMTRDVNGFFLGVTFFLSSPGLLMVGILLFTTKRKLDWFLGALSIIWAIFYWVIVVWAIASGI